MNEAVTGRKAVEQALIRKSLRDESFRRRMIADPKGTIEQELGTKLHAEARVRVLEETPDTLHLVLPPSRASGEFSDKDLDAVAGGEQYGGHVIWNWR